MVLYRHKLLLGLYPEVVLFSMNPELGHFCQSRADYQHDCCVISNINVYAIELGVNENEGRNVEIASSYGGGGLSYNQ